MLLRTRKEGKEGIGMAVYKESCTNTWRVIYRYTDWQGERKQSSKRGFTTKRDALAWERERKYSVNRLRYCPTFTPASRRQHRDLFRTGLAALQRRRDQLSYFCHVNVKAHLPSKLTVSEPLVSRRYPVTRSFAGCCYRRCASRSLLGNTAAVSG
jgi:hypothetical protein